MDVVDNSLFGTKASIFRACIHVHVLLPLCGACIHVHVLLPLCGACIHVHACTLTTVWGLYTCACMYSYHCVYKSITTGPFSSPSPGSRHSMVEVRGHPEAAASPLHRPQSMYVAQPDSDQSQPGLGQTKPLASSLQHDV